jgi:DNA-binding transcriptional regulator YdaS (Cro superfamily)
MVQKITPEQRREVAEKVGVHEQYLYQCLSGRRDMNPAEARRIESETDGFITRQMLCQKTWRGIWPELDTKPAGCLDHLSQEG